MKRYNIIVENAGNLITQGNESYYVLCGILTSNFSYVLNSVRNTNKILRKKNNIPENGEINAKKINMEDQKLLFTAVESCKDTYIVALVAKVKELEVNNNNRKIYYYYLVEKLIEYMIEKKLIHVLPCNTIKLKLNENSILKEDRNTMIYYLKTQLNMEKDYDINLEIGYYNSNNELLLQTAKTFASSIYLPAPTKSRSEIYSKFNKEGKLKIYNFN